MNDLEELFNRQPPYDEESRKRVIAEFRAHRARVLTGEKIKKPVGPKADVVELTIEGEPLPATAKPAAIKLKF